MSTDTEKKFGRRPEDIMEQSGGGLEGRAYLLSELAGSLAAAQHEFAYEDAGAELVRRCHELGVYLEGLFLTEDAKLTTEAECFMCGGEGAYNHAVAGDPFTMERVTCEDCGGSGMYRSKG